PPPAIYTLSLHDALPIYARALVSAGALPAAVQEYIAASKLDPTQAEPIAYAGWITALVAQKVTGPTQQELFDAAAGSLDRAISRSEEHTSELQSPDHLVC